MIDPASIYATKLARLASAGPNGLRIADVGIGTALHMAVVGHAEKITAVSTRVFLTRQGRAAAQQRGDWG